jgi:hypothetical protein
MLEIVDDRFCDNSRERIGRGVPCLALQDLKSFDFHSISSRVSLAT